MSNLKQAVDESGLSQHQAAALNRISKNTRNSVNQGTFGEERVEAIPSYINTDSEVVYKNKNNAWIVLGRDRPAGRASGYGGRGDTQAASIDLVVGRMGAQPSSTAYVDPNFRIDAARIYLSQKTDIDENFNLADGSVGSTKTKSGIGIKADGVRVIARESIKLVTTTDNVNSQGGKVKSIGNIDFIAGNNSDGLEPLVKGEQLKYALKNIMKQLSDITETLNKFMLSQMSFNSAVTTHTHQCVGPWGAPTALPSLQSVTAGAASAVTLA